MFCCTLLYVPSSFAIMLMRKRELVALLSLSSWCLVIVVFLFLAVPWVFLQFVIVVFPDNTHLLFFLFLILRNVFPINILNCFLLAKPVHFFFFTDCWSEAFVLRFFILSRLCFSIFWRCFWDNLPNFLLHFKRFNNLSFLRREFSFVFLPKPLLGLTLFPYLFRNEDDFKGFLGFFCFVLFSLRHFQLTTFASSPSPSSFWF